MSIELNLDMMEENIKSRVTSFSEEILSNVSEKLCDIYLVGPAARGEFSTSNPEITLLLVYSEISIDTLDKIAKLGKTFGKKGIRAPILLTKEYITGAQDSFAMELLDLSLNHIHLGGGHSLNNVAVDNSDLRLQCERECRSWRLRLRANYLKSAGDATWLNRWFVESVADLFQMLRATAYLLDINVKVGNTEIANSLSEKIGLDMNKIVKVWEHRKNSTAPAKGDSRVIFTEWDAMLTKLENLIDGLQITATEND